MRLCEIQFKFRLETFSFDSFAQIFTQQFMLQVTTLYTVYIIHTSNGSDFDFFFCQQMFTKANSMYTKEENSWLLGIFAFENWIRSIRIRRSAYSIDLIKFLCTHWCSAGSLDCCAVRCGSHRHLIDFDDYFRKWEVNCLPHIMQISERFPLNVRFDENGHRIASNCLCVCLRCIRMVSIASIASSPHCKLIKHSHSQTKPHSFIEVLCGLNSKLASITPESEVQMYRWIVGSNNVETPVFIAVYMVDYGNRVRIHAYFCQNA